MKRWIGIDEAGYGPNLGPLVMAAVVAESADDREPDLWTDLAPSVSRAGGPTDSLWVDDSKAILKGRKGRDRLDQAAFTTLQAAGIAVPTTFSAWFDAVGAGSFDEVELSPWLEPGADPPLSPLPRLPMISPLHYDAWRIVGVHAVVVGPRRFNVDIVETDSKATAHFRAFARLLGPLWQATNLPTLVRCDKHGGRNFYGGPLSDGFPDARIDRGEEGPSLSRYVMRQEDRRMTLEFRPRADRDSGLVALASITAKAIREAWMDRFNEFWSLRIPGLKPTAGYPVDALRFRCQIEPIATDLSLLTHDWWRMR